MKFNCVGVAGFIESSPSKTHLEGITVNSPDQVSSTANVIVASEYWQQIYQHIQSHGFNFQTLRRALF